MPKHTKHFSCFEVWQLGLYVWFFFYHCPNMFEQKMADRRGRTRENSAKSVKKTKQQEKKSTMHRFFFHSLKWDEVLKNEFFLFVVFFLLLFRFFWDRCAISMMFNEIMGFGWIMKRHFLMHDLQKELLGNVQISCENGIKPRVSAVVLFFTIELGTNGFWLYLFYCCLEENDIKSHLWWRTFFGEAASKRSTIIWKYLRFP